MGNKKICVCMAHFQEKVQAFILKKLYERAQKNNYIINVYSMFEDMFYCDENDQGEKAMLDMIDYSQYDALILFAETIKSNDVLKDIIDKATATGIPVISIDKHFDGTVGVLIEHERTFEKIVRHVIEEHGCRRVNFIAGFKGNEFSEPRVNIYKKVLAENGIEFDEKRLGYGNFWSIPALQCLEEFLRYDIPDAIICANDSMAIAIAGKLSELGIDIPEQVIVSGYDGLEAARCFSPTITTGGPRYEDLGSKAMDILEDYFDKGILPENDICVDSVMIPGQSCGCVPMEKYVYSSQISNMHKKIDSIQDYSRNMFRMISKANRGEIAPEQIAECAKDYINPWLACDGIVLCVFDNFMYSISEKPQELSDTDSTVIMEYDGKSCFSPMRRFSTGNSLPVKGGVFPDAKMTITLPMYLTHELLGFMILSHKPNEEFYLNLFSFGHSIKNIIQSFKNQMQLQYVNERLENLYKRDALTGLYNRNGFYSEFEQIKNIPCMNSFLIIGLDLDGLKVINDSYGHAEGDFAISEMGNLLKTCPCEYSIPARFGGDEYVVLALSSKSKKDLEDEIIFWLDEGMKKINDDCNKPYIIHGSYGIISEEIKNIDKFDELMKQADDEMYLYKRFKKEKTQ